LGCCRCWAWSRRGNLRFRFGGGSNRERPTCRQCDKQLERRVQVLLYRFAGLLVYGRPRYRETMGVFHKEFATEPFEKDAFSLFRHGLMGRARLKRTNVDVARSSSSKNGRPIRGVIDGAPDEPPAEVIVSEPDGRGQRAQFVLKLVRSFAMTC